MDIDLQAGNAPRYRIILNEYIASADGVVLLYDITEKSSWHEVIDASYPRIYDCRNTIFTRDGTEGRMQGVKNRFGCVVVGNKRDLVDEDEEKRKVGKEMAEQWAASQGFRHFEITSNERGEVEDVIRALVDSVQRARRMNARDVGESKREGGGGVMGWGVKIVKRMVDG
jgi:GTPase SAR1 family protein